MGRQLIYIFKNKIKDMKNKYLLLLTLVISSFLLSQTSAEDVVVRTEIQPTLSIVFNYNTIDFGILTIGSNNNPAPNQTNGIYNVTVNTNQNFKVEASGTTFTGATHNFSISNLKMDTNPVAQNLSLSNVVILTTSPQIIDNNINYTVTTHFHGFWLSIPSSQYAEKYNSTLTITYSNIA